MSGSQGTLLKDIAGSCSMSEHEWSDMEPVLQHLSESAEESEALRAACALSAEAAGRPFRLYSCLIKM